MTIADALTALAAVYATVRRDGAELSLAEHVDALASLQEAENVLAASKLLHMAHAAARQERLGEDGEWTERHLGLGHFEMDAADLMAPCLGLSSQAAATRVGDAVDLVTRTPALVEEVAAGALDSWRARVVSTELSDAPAETAATIVAELISRAENVGGWIETAGPLRRRAQQLLAKHAPDVLADRAETERADRGLTCQMNNLGTDRWVGIIPIEDSRLAWSAIDTLAKPAHDRGETDTLAQARVEAMVSLILGNTRATVHLHATTTCTDLPARTDLRAGSELPTGTELPVGSARAETHRNPATEGGSVLTAPRVSSTSTTSLATGASTREVVSELAVQANPDASESRVVAIGAYGKPGTSYLSREWLDNALATGRVTTAPVLTVHPRTGALLTGDLAHGITRSATDTKPSDSDSGTGSGARTGKTHGSDSGSGTGTGTGTGTGYRIPAAMQRLVKLRDGTCRFPGCTVNARFTDLDHVEPWPLGPTDPSNLACLCRRHHRIKQGTTGARDSSGQPGAPRWHATLHPDATMTWTDPTGRRHTTHPQDHTPVLALPSPPQLSSTAESGATFTSPSAAKGLSSAVGGAHLGSDAIRTTYAESERPEVPELPELPVFWVHYPPHEDLKDLLQQLAHKRREDARREQAASCGAIANGEMHASPVEARLVRYFVHTGAFDPVRRRFVTLNTSGAGTAAESPAGNAARLGAGMGAVGGTASSAGTGTSGGAMVGPQSGAAFCWAGAPYDGPHPF